VPLDHAEEVVGIDRQLVLPCPEHLRIGGFSGFLAAERQGIIEGVDFVAAWTTMMLLTSSRMKRPGPCLL